MSVSEAQVREIVEKVVDAMLTSAPTADLKVAIGSDHGGFEMKTALAEQLRTWGYQVTDCGTNSKDSVDYPDFAEAVSRAVQEGRCQRGIVVDTAGIGSSMAANKLNGVRAALCYDEKTIKNSRLHNDANVLSLGAAYHSTAQAAALARLWLETEFEGGRHQKRIDKITALEANCACKTAKA